MRVVFTKEKSYFKRHPIKGCLGDKHYKPGDEFRNVQVEFSGISGDTITITFPDGETMPGVALNAFKIYSSDE